jgi:predicted membrane channel-forming protein YqfA (hemolysin III family)
MLRFISSYWKHLVISTTAILFGLLGLLYFLAGSVNYSPWFFIAFLIFGVVWLIGIIIYDSRLYQ